MAERPADPLRREPIRSDGDPAARRGDRATFSVYLPRDLREAMAAAPPELNLSAAARNGIRYALRTLERARRPKVVS